MRRRPAAALVPRRRPAGAIEESPERRRAPEDIGAVFAKGEVILAGRCPPALLERGQWLVSEQSTYFEEPCKWAGKLVRLVLEGGEIEAQFELTGTQTESLLKYASAQSPPLIRAHFCGSHCDQKRSNPDLVHLKSFRKLEDAAEKTWETNLIVVDENAPLRRAQAEWQIERGDAKVAPQEVASSEASHGKKKKKKKKKSQKEGSSQRKTRKFGGKSVATKPLKDLYKGTGLDPEPRTRKKVRRLVKKKLKRSRDSSSTSSSGTSSTSGQGVEDEILEDRSKIQKIATIGPGVLTEAALRSMKQFVLQTGGSTWAMDEDSLPPVMMQYARMHLAPRASGGLLKEVLTLSFIGDLLLQGRPTEALDTLSQRLKSLELVIAGTPWSTAQKVEITPNLEAMISTRAELQVAQKESKLDSQAKGSSGAWDKTKGKSKGKDKEKGKGEKGKGKAKEEPRKSS